MGDNALYAIFLAEVSDISLCGRERYHFASACGEFDFIPREFVCIVGSSHKVFFESVYIVNDKRKSFVYISLFVDYCTAEVIHKRIFKSVCRFGIVHKIIRFPSVDFCHSHFPFAF